MIMSTKLYLIQFTIYVCIYIYILRNEVLFFEQKYYIRQETEQSNLLLSGKRQSNFLPSGRGSQINEATNTDCRGETNYVTPLNYKLR